MAFVRFLLFLSLISVSAGESNSFFSLLILSVTKGSFINERVLFVSHVPFNLRKKVIGTQCKGDKLTLA